MRRNSYALFFDFDGTIADTFDTDAEGLIDVRDAYLQAVERVFGPEGLEVYERQGGLKNRAPTEVINDMFDPEQDGEPKLRTVGERHADDLLRKQRAVPETYGPELEWNASSLDNLIAEALVYEKKLVLCDQIGTPLPDGEVWPHPGEDFRDAWESLEPYRDSNSRFRITTGVISSGHTDFISETFEAWGLSQPDILVTDDHIRPRANPRESSRRNKPGQLPLALAHREWLQMEGHDGYSYDILEAARASKSRLLYVGDDPNKDGGLAEGAGIEFLLYDPTGERGISSFRELSNVILANKELLIAGRPIGELVRRIAPEVREPGELIRQR